RSPERGPIEANTFRWEFQMGREFPRSPERGPIEARTFPCRSSAHDRYFRAHQSAAPLKPLEEEGGGCSRHVFPRSPERGPIEAGYRVLFPGHVLVFPRSPERGPIEA